MPLNLSRLEKVVDLGNGAKQARCPACAAGGQDRTGEHLRISADGRFGCCVHPKDSEHRKRIYALAGERSKPSTIKVRVASPIAPAAVQASIIRRLEQVFPAATAVPKAPDASDGVCEVQTQLFEVRTPRTGEPKSDCGSAEANREQKANSRTSRTPLSNSLYAAEADSQKGNNICATLKEFCNPVRDVRESELGERADNPPTELEKGVRSVWEVQPAEKLPYFTPGGTLVIPFDSPERYHWWKGGQSVAQTRQEVLERMKDHGTTI